MGQRTGLFRTKFVCLFAWCIMRVDPPQKPPIQAADEKCLMALETKHVLKMVFLGGGAEVSAAGVAG